MKIGLVGWGIETQSAYRYFGPEHTYVIGNEELRDDFPTSDNVTIYAIAEKRPRGLVGNVDDLSYLDHYDDCDLIVYQGAAHKNLEKKFPGNHSFWQNAKTTLHILFEQCDRSRIIAVTGTKGKGTTTTLIYELLKAAGKDVVLGGNIGIPVLDLLKDIHPDTWIVLELSSFQLYKFPYSPHIGVHLMMVPEHIEEWHKTMEDYVAAKQNIFAHQTNDDVAIYLPTNTYSSSAAERSSGTKIAYTTKDGAYVHDGVITIADTPILATSEAGLIGEHNLQNICAALTAAWQVAQNVDAYKKTLREFRGLEHRLQLVREVDGVRYYDDSFGTVPNTAQVALDAFTEPKVIILGGHDKGNDWTDMVQRLKADDVRHIILIGTITERLLTLMQQAGVDMGKITYKEDGDAWSMSEIVERARHTAQSGDVVLLSTGSASFGIFKDYKDRGNQFIQAVQALV